MSALDEDAPYEALWEALGQLEDARAALHDRLRAARFAFSTTQAVEERRGRLLAYEAVPVAAGVVRPTRGLRSRRDHNNNNDSNNDDDDGVSWVVDPLPGPEGGEGEDGSAMDPICYFSAAPSEELRDCQRLFRQVLEDVVVVDRAQKAVLRIAANLPVANPGDGNDEDKKPPIPK
ncbi:unnamed protein product [Phytomonas sp. EM1]|nr:unnamed protein product [Phytomonas sp. EM1]|eukprot:CCW64064.1 unnamed protein product [Phytomonas sp. isolate EM1]